MRNPTLTAEERAAGRLRITRPHPIPQPIQLTDAQEAAAEAMVNFEHSKTSDVLVLTGAAGTGKTTVLMDYLSITNAEVVLTAPTNKAVRVLAEMATAHGVEATCCTVHKLLGLVLRDDAEERYCSPDAPEAIPVFDVLVVDECSMVGNRPAPSPAGEVPGLFDTLMNQVERWGRQFNRRIKVIFVGDPCQLPPVKEGNLSPTFDAGPRIHLDEVVRQASVNPILSLATYIRNKLEDRNLAAPRPALTDDEFSGVCSIKDRDEFEELMALAYEDDPSHPTLHKVLAFRNVTVDRYNALVRENLFGVNPERWIMGERYVATQPVIENQEIVASTDEDAVLTSMGHIHRHPRFPQYRGMMLTLDGHDASFQAFVPAPEDEERWKQDLRDLATRAQLPRSNPRHLPWSNYWELHDAFAHLRPHYAMTCHRSQGSTYRNVFVDAHDILSHPSGSWEGLRCLYTAITRASHMVYVLE